MASSLDVELVQKEYTLDENEYADMRVVVKSPDFVGGENGLCFMANNIHYVRKIDDYTTEVNNVDAVNENDLNVVLYPNPSSGRTHTHLFNDVEQYIDMTVNDVFGNKVLTLFSGTILQGNNDFEISDLNSGNYFVVVNGSKKRSVYPFIVIH